MLNRPLKEDRIKKLKLFSVIYVAIYCALALKIYIDQGYILKIMSNPVYVVASIDNITSESRFKRGTEIIIRYSFESKGESYSGLYRIPESTFNREYASKDSIEVVYRKDSPNLHMTRNSVQGYTSTGTLPEKLVKLIIFALVVALIPYSIIAFALGWMKLK